MSDRPMIVHARKPKRRTKTESATAPPIATIVTAHKPGTRRPPAPEAFNPEVDAEVRKWFDENVRRPPRR